MHNDELLRCLHSFLIISLGAFYYLMWLMDFSEKIFLAKILVFFLPDDDNQSTTGVSKTVLQKCFCKLWRTCSNSPLNVVVENKCKKLLSDYGCIEQPETAGYDPKLTTLTSGRNGWRHRKALRLGCTTRLNARSRSPRPMITLTHNEKGHT